MAYQNKTSRLQFARVGKDLVLISRRTHAQKTATAAKLHAQQTKAGRTLKTYKCTHGAASKKTHVFQLPSLKEDTAEEHGGRERKRGGGGGERGEVQAGGWGGGGGEGLGDVTGGVRSGGGGGCKADSRGSGLNLTAGYATTVCLQAVTGSPGSSAGGPHAPRQIHFPHRHRK